MKRRTFLKTLGIIAGGLTFSPSATINALKQGKRFVKVPLDHQLFVAGMIDESMPSSQIKQRVLKPMYYALKNEIKRKDLIRVGKFRILKQYDIENDCEYIRIDAFCYEAKYLK